MQSDRLRQSARKTLNSFVRILPIVMGMLLLTSLAVTAVPQERIAVLFGHSNLADVLLGASLGSIAAGHPLLSYVLGGELLGKGVSLFAVTALIVSWVTVGVVQLPAEALLLGRRFALWRNALCFLSAIAVALLTAYTLRWLGGA